MISITIFILIAIFLVVLLTVMAILLFQAGKGVGFLCRHVCSFFFGVIGDLIGVVGAIIAGVVLSVLAMLSVVIARWSAANHYARSAQQEAVVLGSRLWGSLVHRPLRLLFLDGLLVGVERRVPGAISSSPGRDRPAEGIRFPGFQVTGSLPPGGSGAELFIARPVDTEGSMPSAVVIKSFSLSQGSSLPQIVRESKGLDAARRLGLVLESHLDESRFWYVMPYRAGDHLTRTVQLLHGRSEDKGLRGKALESIIENEIDLLQILSSYHKEGLWHKDVKPDNIIVEDERVHLVDLGLVTPLGSAMTLTTHGTEYFRDPEMVRMALSGVKVHQIDGAKFDIYASGAVLYYMLENTFPAHGALSRFENDAPEVLRWIVRRAMTDYESRYESAEAMLADLHAVAVFADPWAMRPADLPSLGGELVQVPTSRRQVATQRTPVPPPPLVLGPVSAKTRRSNPHQPVHASLALLALGVIATIICMVVFSGVVGNTTDVSRQSEVLLELDAGLAPSNPVGLGRFVVINDHPAFPDSQVEDRVEAEISQLEGLGWRSVHDDPAAVAALSVALRQYGARKGGPFDPVLITLKRLDLEGVLWITSPQGQEATGYVIKADFLRAPEEGEVTDSSTSLRSVYPRGDCPIFTIPVHAQASSGRQCSHGIAA